MPLWSGVIRILRKRLVLGAIFSLSVIYCGFSLLRPDKKGLELEIDYYDFDANDVNDMSNRADTNKLLDKTWQMEASNNEEIGSIVEEEAPGSNRSQIGEKPCRNSVQGKSLLVDDKGYVCQRLEISPNGCCPVILVREKENPVEVDRFSCDTCNSEGCCAVYEYCVSCCVDPNKHIKSKKKTEGEAARKDSLKARRGEDVFRLRLRNLDRFQICLAICRTSSASVRHENTYKDPNSKHCYNLNHLMPQRSRRDVFPVNNNFDGSHAVVAFFSESLFTDLSLHYGSKMT